MVQPRRRSARSVAIANGWRSGLEEAIGEQLASEGIEYGYESVTIPFVQPVKPRKYTPDYVLPNGIILESKGRFVTADRSKHLMVREQHPALDIRFIFSNSRTRISKQSKTTYAGWCEAKGFLFADKLIPASWLREKANKKSLEALKELMAPRRG